MKYFSFFNCQTLLFIFISNMVFSTVHCDTDLQSTENRNTTKFIGVSALGAESFRDVLDLGLVGFTGACNDTTIVLEWSMTSETVNGFFSIEQSSDGINWLSIGTVSTTGTSSGNHNYSFKDLTFRHDISYYRLCHIEDQMNFKYSNAIEVETCTTAKKSDVIIYPNPTNGLFNLLVNSNTSDNEFVEIFNSQGEKVYYSDQDISSIDLIKNPDGLYFLNYNVNGKNTMKKIELKR